MPSSRLTRAAPMLLAAVMLLCHPLALRASEVVDESAELTRIIEELRASSTQAGMGGVGMGLNAGPAGGGRNLLGATSGLGALSALSNLGSTFKAALPTIDIYGNTITSQTPDLQTLVNDFNDLNPFNNNSAVARTANNVIQALNPLNLISFNGMKLGDIASAGPVVLDPGLNAIVTGIDTSASAVAVLGLLSGIFNLVSAILYIVSGALGTAAAALGLIPATLGLITGPAGFGIAADQFGLTLSADTTLPTIVQRYETVLNNVADSLAGLRNGTISGSLLGARSQLGQAGGLLRSVLAKYNPGALTSA